MSCATKRPRPKDDTASEDNDSLLDVIAPKRAKLIDDNELLATAEVDVATITNAGGDQVNNGIKLNRGDITEGTDTAKPDRKQNKCSNLKTNEAMTPELSRCVFIVCIIFSKSF